LTATKFLCEAELMPCPLCGKPKARRACPALGHEICAVCCGTKRLVEIDCPSDCAYLASAKAHPPAVVQRRQDQDLRFVAGMLGGGFTDLHYGLFALLQSKISDHERHAIPPLVDRDIADACGALASTLETAARGIIYAHQPASLPAQRLLNDLQALVEDIGRKSSRSIDGDAAFVLRRIETGAGAAASALGGGERAFVEMLRRVGAAAAERGGKTRDEEGPEPEDRPRLIVP
jgi:hypothetical protein